MKKESTQQRLPTPASWVCSHCYSREPMNRVLLRTAEELPLEQDRRWYWHMGKTVGLKRAEHPVKLLDWRLLDASQVVWRNRSVFMNTTEGVASGGRACIHCHMPVVEPLVEAKFVPVLSNSRELTDRFLQGLDCQHSVDTQTDPGDLPLERFVLAHQCLTRDVAIRYERGNLWLALHNEGFVPKDRAYGQLLWDRQCLNADGYVLLLQLEKELEDDSACILLEWLLDLHGDPGRVRQKAACVVLVMPEGQAEQELSGHVRVLKLLELLFKKYDKMVPEDGNLADSDMKAAVEKLAIRLELLEPQLPQEGAAITPESQGKTQDGSSGQQAETGEAVHKDEIDGNTGG